MSSQAKSPVRKKSKLVEDSSSSSSEDDKSDSKRPSDVLQGVGEVFTSVDTPPTGSIIPDKLWTDEAVQRRLRSLGHLRKLTDREYCMLPELQQFEHEVFVKYNKTLIHKTTKQKSPIWNMFIKYSPEDLKMNKDGEMALHRNCFCMLCWQDKGTSEKKFFDLRVQGSNQANMKYHLGRYHVEEYAFVTKTSKHGKYHRDDVEKMNKVLEKEGISFQPSLKQQVGIAVPKGPMAKYLKKKLTVRNAGVKNLDVINLMLVLWLVVKGRPPNMINDELFVFFVQMLEDSYHPPSYRTYVKLEEKLGLHLYAKLQNSLDAAKEFFGDSDLGWLSFQYDGWTSHDNKSYLGISISFYDPISNQKLQVILAIFQLTEGKKAVDLAKSLERVFEIYGISNSSLFHAVRDGEAAAQNASNLVKNGLFNDSCFCHDLQTVVKHATACADRVYKRYPFPEAKTLWDRLRRLVAFFTQSPKQTRGLEEIQEELIEAEEDDRKQRVKEARERSEPIPDTRPEPVRFTTFSATRWTGSMNVVARVLRLKKPLMQFFEEHLVSEREEHEHFIDEVMWKQLEGIQALLFLFHNATVKMQGRDYICRSYARVFIDWIKSSLEKSKTKPLKAEYVDGVSKGKLYKAKIEDDMVCKMRDRLLERLDWKFGSVEEDELDMLSMILDPRVKEYAIAQAKKTRSISIEEIGKLVTKHTMRSITKLTSEAPSDKVVSGKTSVKVRSIYDDSDEEDTDEEDDVVEAETALGDEQKLRSEVARFIEFVPFSTDDAKLGSCLAMLQTIDPITWYNSEMVKKSFPTIRKLALRVLTAPRTSVYQEQVFSYTGPDSEKTRCRTEAKRLNLRQFIRFNYLLFIEEENDTIKTKKERLVSSLDDMCKEFEDPSSNPFDKIAIPKAFKSDDDAELVDTLVPLEVTGSRGCPYCELTILQHLRCSEEDQKGQLICDGEDCVASIDIGDDFYTCQSCGNYDLCINCINVES